MLIILLLPILAFARASQSVPVDSRVYRAIDRLVAAGVVDNVIIGQRPYSEDAISKIFEEADRNFDRLKNSADKMMVWRILRYWDETIPAKDSVIPAKAGISGAFLDSRLRGNDNKWKVRFLNRLDIDNLYLYGPDRLVPAARGKTVGAHVRPLTAYDGGRRFATGYNYAFESYHFLKGPHFILFAHPRFQVQIRDGNQEEEDKIFVQELYGKVGWWNLELEVGRDELAWGQGEYGGFLFTNNARPADFVKLSNPYPAKIPWLGNVRTSILLSNMGPSYKRKYAYLTAMKLSLEPVKYVELGPYYAFIAGGENSASGSYKMGGTDLRLRIPQASSMEIYGEIYLESLDLDHPGSVFRDNAGYLGGIYLPRLAGANNMALRFEYRHTGTLIYRDSRWPSGYSLSGEFLGDSLGPNADGAYANYYYDLGMASRLIARFAYEGRRSGTVTEKRYRGTLGLEHPIKKILNLKWHFGYEAINDFNFNQGDNQGSMVATLNLTFNLGL